VVKAEESLNFRFRIQDKLKVKFSYSK